MIFDLRKASQETSPRVVSLRVPVPSWSGWRYPFHASEDWEGSRNSAYSRVDGPKAIPWSRWRWFAPCPLVFSVVAFLSGGYFSRRPVSTRTSSRLLVKGALEDAALCVAEHARCLARFVVVGSAAGYRYRLGTMNPYRRWLLPPPCCHASSPTAQQRGARGGSPSPVHRRDRTR